MPNRRGGEEISDDCLAIRPGARERREDLRRSSGEFELLQILSGVGGIPSRNPILVGIGPDKPEEETHRPNIFNGPVSPLTNTGPDFQILVFMNYSVKAAHPTPK